LHYNFALSHQNNFEISISFLVDVDEKIEEPDTSMTLSLEEELDDKKGNVTHYEELYL
jgi:hypothetical protein